jgi:hypothetical protein
MWVTALLPSGTTCEASTLQQADEPQTNQQARARAAHAARVVPKRPPGSDARQLGLSKSVCERRGGPSSAARGRPFDEVTVTTASAALQWTLHPSSHAATVPLQQPLARTSAQHAAPMPPSTRQAASSTPAAALSCAGCASTPSVQPFASTPAHCPQRRTWIGVDGGLSRYDSTLARACM